MVSISIKFEIVINFSKNFGQHSALMAGFRYSCGNIVVYLDDDGQCPTNKIFDLIEPLSKGFDVSMADYGVKNSLNLKIGAVR